MFDWHKLTDTNELSEHQREMPRRFQGSFVIIKTPNGNQYPVQYNRCTRTGHDFTSTKYGTIHLNYDTEAEVVPHFPEPGLYIVGGRMVVFLKTPARQWKRGVNASNASLKVIDTPGALYQTIPIDEESFKALFIQSAFPTKYDLKELFKEDIIFDRTWGITHTGQLVFSGTIVGDVSRDGGVTTVSVIKEFVQEAKDMFGKFDNWSIQVANPKETT